VHRTPNAESLAAVGTALRSFFAAVTGQDSFCSELETQAGCFIAASAATVHGQPSGNGGFCRQNQFENPYWTGRTVQRRYRRGD
jgi:hypothetical protein